MCGRNATEYLHLLHPLPYEPTLVDQSRQPFRKELNCAGVIGIEREDQEDTESRVALEVAKK